MSINKDEEMREEQIDTTKTDAQIVQDASDYLGREEAMEEDELIKAHLSVLKKELRCTFCSGFGHDANHCTTLQ